MKNRRRGGTLLTHNERNVHPTAARDGGSSRRIDRVISAVDYPYSSIDDGQRLLERTELAPADLENPAHWNAERLLGLNAE
jgi:predicted TIM-barrel fold metal-dependent hydrolase